MPSPRSGERPEFLTNGSMQSPSLSTYLIAAISATRLVRSVAPPLADEMADADCFMEPTHHNP